MGRDISKGMWCKDEDGRLGLASTDDVFEKNGVPKIDGNGKRVQEPTFHLVNAKGETTMVVYRMWLGLVQAEFKDLPPDRCGHLSRDEAATLGYV